MAPMNISRFWTWRCALLVYFAVPELAHGQKLYRIISLGWPYQ